MDTIHRDVQGHVVSTIQEGVQADGCTPHIDIAPQEGVWMIIA